MDAHVRLIAARVAAAEGRFEEALREHVWFHEHALQQDPSLYAVRLSSALRDWVALGEAYPEARRTLLAVRDGKAAALLAGKGTRELFEDVAAIDEHLGDLAHTHRLFRGIARVTPALARRCGDLAFAAVAKAGDHRLAVKILPRIDWIAGCFQESCAWSGADGDAAELARTRAVAVDLYVEEVQLVLTVLRGVGRDDEAALTRQRALDLVEDDALRELVRAKLPARRRTGTVREGAAEGATEA